MVNDCSLHEDQLCEALSQQIPAHLLTLKCLVLIRSQHAYFQRNVMTYQEPFRTPPGQSNSFGIDSIFQLIPIPDNFISDSSISECLDSDSDSKMTKNQCDSGIGIAHL